MTQIIPRTPCREFRTQECGPLQWLGVESTKQAESIRRSNADNLNMQGGRVIYEEVQLLGV
jgi:hypothetical protein